MGSIKGDPSTRKISGGSGLLVSALRDYLDKKVRFVLALRQKNVLNVSCYKSKSSGGLMTRVFLVFESHPTQKICISTLLSGSILFESPDLTSKIEFKFHAKLPTARILQPNPDWLFLSFWGSGKF
ncbi:hypothetical protein TNCT_282911 [Trichonephila clavata]|uniref:Uncharacterized protein n=1 Tax=Trichonephila clavata TaxID=2740835 RepID=A0A8X6JDP5_TRICU|nr:hypothetical protein TNCT_282911 [Trichonephila clavata]